MILFAIPYPQKYLHLYIFIKCIIFFQNKLFKSEQRYEILKKHAEDKLEEANKEIDSVSKQQECTTLHSLLYLNFGINVSFIKIKKRSIKKSLILKFIFIKQL